MSNPIIKTERFESAEEHTAFALVLGVFADGAALLGIRAGALSVSLHVANPDDLGDLARIFARAAAVAKEITR